jgi:hypothetical protein
MVGGSAFQPLKSGKKAGAASFANVCLYERCGNGVAEKITGN